MSVILKRQKYHECGQYDLKCRVQVIDYFYGDIRSLTAYSCCMKKKKKSSLDIVLNYLSVPWMKASPYRFGMKVMFRQKRLS